MKVTSAYANKLLKQLEEEKEYWLSKERESCLYTVSVGEEPVIPDYDFTEVDSQIRAIDQKICRVKHAVNRSNAAAEIPVGNEVMSADVILVRMAQLNKRKATLDHMRKQLPKARVEETFGARKAVPEYRYVNYDLETVRAEYEAVSQQVMDMQMALDKYNQTVEFELDL